MGLDVAAWLLEKGGGQPIDPLRDFLSCCN